MAPHTEFTRLLAEHGVFGVIITALMVWMLVRGYLANPSGPGRAIAASLIVWSVSVMFHSATRIAAIPLMLALSMAVWQMQPGAWRSEADEPPAEPDNGALERKR